MVPMLALPIEQPITLPKMSDVFDLPRLLNSNETSKPLGTPITALGMSEAGTGDKTIESVSPHQDAIDQINSQIQLILVKGACSPTEQEVLCSLQEQINSFKLNRSLAIER